MLHIYYSSSRFPTVFIRKHHSMHILTSLHWLPAHFRMTLNTFEACLGLAPGYLAAFLVSCESACSPTSLGGAFLVLPGCKSEGGQACAVTSSRLWNNMPEEIRLAFYCPFDYHNVKHLLKSWLLKAVVHTQIILSLCSLMCNILPEKSKIRGVILKTFFRLLFFFFFLQFSGTNISNTLEWHHNSMTWKSELRGGNEYIRIIKCSRNKSTVFSLYKI